MQFIPVNPILKFNPTTLEDIRRCWNLENERMGQSVGLLEEWISKQNHFVNKSFSRKYLEKTPIACKGSVEKAKSQIDKICTLKTLLPKFFIPGNVKKNLGEVAEIACMVPLSNMTKDHYRVVVLRISAKGFTAAQYLDFYQLVMVSAEYLKAHDYTNGFIIIEDLRDVSLTEILTKINFVEIQEFLSILVEGFGTRLKAVHLLTQTKVVDVFVKTFKPLISAKLRDRIHVQRDLEELHSVVDKKLLPLEYGGEEKSYEKLKSDWFDIISSEEHEKYLAEMKTFCTDETLRTSEKFNEQIMGLPGSFRSLTVD